MRRRDNLAESVDEAVIADFAPAVRRLNRDLQKAAAELSEAEARYLVDTYYEIQAFRIAAAGQVRSTTKLPEPKEPNAFLAFTADSMRSLERNIVKAMDIYTDGKRIGRWAKAQVGIGPVLAGGLQAHIDPKIAQTAGAVWRFLGLDPTLRWIGTEKARELVKDVLKSRKVVTPADVLAVANALNRRVEAIERLARHYGDGKLTATSLTKAASQRPYNAKGKVLCWKLGQSFFRLHHRHDCLYGKLIERRWALEQQRDAAGANAKVAAEVIASGRIKDPETRAMYASGHLPKGRILLRAQRYGVKIFLAHYWQRAREAEGLPVAVPYILTKPEHTHEIKAPPWPPGDEP